MAACAPCCTRAGAEARCGAAATPVLKASILRTFSGSGFDALAISRPDAPRTHAADVTLGNFAMKMMSLVLAAALAGVSSQALAQAAATAVGGVEVVADTPLGTADRATVAAPVQTLTADQIARGHALDLSAALNRSLGSVYINDVQNNPLQPDVNYRGYTASPLLGTPQGLSLYLDGMRLNQPFGDVVSWDLIPKAAIASATLQPGSNPLFGLNTLGGALAITTKDGRANPGSAIELNYGSYSRWQVEGETGGSAGNGLYWFATANHLADDGWRDFSPSKATQAFGKIGWANDRTDIALTAGYADTDLTGNGFQDQQLLAGNYHSVFTKPDNTRNLSGFANLTWKQNLSDALTFSGSLYHRDLHTKTVNGDINDDSLGENVYQPSAAERAALTAAGITGFPLAGETAANTPFPKYRCIANALLDSEPNEKCNGLFNRGRIAQEETGVSGQFDWKGRIGGLSNHALFGAAYNGNRAHFTQSSQFGYLTPDRGVIGVTGPGAFADGSQDSENAFDARVDLHSRTHVASVFAADTVELASGLNVTVSGRYDSTKVRNRDAITPGGGPGSLTANHSFDRFNPAIGVTWAASDALTAYAGYNEGSRAPSSIELGCSDPDNPCRLPNALAGDPPLKQVVTKTVEAGLRGRVEGVAWRAGVFRAENHNDIQFVADDPSGYGYFKNFGRTRRQGVELGLDGRAGPVSFGANYTYLDATYESTEVIPGEGNSTNSVGPGFEGTITVRPGARIPLVPKSIFKANLGWDVTDKLTLNADAVAVGGVYARGNENNQHRADGVYYLGAGKTKSYAVLNLGAEYRVLPNLKAFVQVDNVFDKKYSTAAQLGTTGFNAGGAFVARPFSGPTVDGELPGLGSTFYGPGAPRLVWTGVRYSF
jgi:outer membrane receptor protein involved in Fe transport